MLAADSEFRNEKDNNVQNIPLVAPSSASQRISILSCSSQHQNTSEVPENEKKKSKTRVEGIAVSEGQVKEKTKSATRLEKRGIEISKDAGAIPDTDNSNLVSSSATEMTIAKRKSSSAQTRLEDFEQAAGRTNSKSKPSSHSNPNGADITIPLSIITLQSILISARSKAETEISPKQYGVYQLSKEIILLFQESLQSERDAYDFIGRPIKDVLGHPIDRMAWWFWIIQKSVEDLRPPPGYILPALKMLRQEITSLADGAVEIITVQKTIHKQLRRMAGILNSVFARYEDIFGVRDWEHTLRKNRSDDAGLINEKYERWLKTTASPPPENVKLTCFETKSILLQHNTNEDYPPISLNKIDLKRQKEFIKSCLHHMNSLLRQSCMDSVKAHEDLSKAESEIQENIDKLVKKIENLRRAHRFRETTCAVLLKKSLSSLGLCLYEFIDMVIFIRKLGRFVLLASQHVLRYANTWSHLCDVTCLNQLDSVLTEFSEGEAFVLFQCFEKWSGKSSKCRKREKVMAAFEEYIHHWNASNVRSTIQVQLPMSLETSKIIFGKEERTAASTTKQGTSCKKSDSVMAGRKKTKVSIPDIYSTKELDITFIAKGTRPIPVPTESMQDIDTVQKLEEIGIKLDKDGTSNCAGVSGRLGEFSKKCNSNSNVHIHSHPKGMIGTCSGSGSGSRSTSMSIFRSTSASANSKAMDNRKLSKASTQQENPPIVLSKFSATNLKST